MTTHPVQRPHRFRDRRPRRSHSDFGLMLCGLAAVLASACASSSPARVALAPQAAGLQGVVVRSQDLIGRAQLIGTGEPSVYDALRQVRADLFRTNRPAGAAADEVLPAVYVNEFYQGDVEVLRGITTDVVRDVQIVRSIDTAMRFGRAHPAGALMVRLQLR